VDVDDRYWRALQAGDARFDGWVYCGVTSTGIYCRPSCPARTPKRANVRFYPTAAAAQAAGFRACKRCRPDAAPGSPEWDRRGDLAGRAMRLISDGVVDRDGVDGLARQLGYTTRHVHRELVAVAGAGPLALARAQRAQTARLLLETTDVSVSDTAFAAGFQSIRQFNATIRDIFAATPSELRGKARRARPSSEPGTIVLRLPCRSPWDGRALVGFLARRATPGVEEVVDGTYRRSLDLPYGEATVELTPGDGHAQARLHLADLRDLATAVRRCRTLLDLDSDPVEVASVLGADPVLGPLVRPNPGQRVPGHVDGHELAIRALLGQHARLRDVNILAGRLTATLGRRLKQPAGGITHLFPPAATIAGSDLGWLRLPAAHLHSTRQLSHAIADGDLVLDDCADLTESRNKVSALSGIGPWAAGYIALRTLRDPDVFLPTDPGIRRALKNLGQPVPLEAAGSLAERWRPYRSYATVHLWAQLPGIGSVQHARDQSDGSLTPHPADHAGF
jgi:AraC family transcriptional regulator, regulatory protein of adaptative response / DNA-3-methyladenine glycosylase II